MLPKGWIKLTLCGTTEHVYVNTRHIVSVTESGDYGKTAVCYIDGDRDDVEEEAQEIMHRIREAAE